MSAKHTPGPWKLAGESVSKQTFVYALNDRGTNQFWFDIQPGWTCDGVRTSDAELEANARLIAAAPDLLAALTALMGDHGGSLGVSRTDERALAARAALAKATGDATAYLLSTDANAARLRGSIAEFKANWDSDPCIDRLDEADLAIEREWSARVNNDAPRPADYAALHLTPEQALADAKGAE